MGTRNCLTFALIGTTALLTAVIGNADATQNRSHAQVMTTDGKGYLPISEAEFQTELVQATIALRKTDDLEHMKAQAKAA